MVTRKSLRSGVGPWLLEWCVVGEKVEIADAYQNYVLYADINGFGALGSDEFRSQMHKMGFAVSTTRVGRVFRGLELR